MPSLCFPQPRFAPRRRARVLAAPAPRTDTPPMSLPAPTPTPPPEQTLQLAHAKARFAKVRKAINVAGFNGWTALVFGSLTLLVALLSAALGSFGLPGLFVGLGITAGAVHELIARAQLKKLDPRALPRLAWNQALFAGVIVLYCVWSMLDTNSSFIAEAIAKAKSQAGGQIDESMTQTLTQAGDAVVLIARAFYALVIILTILIEASIAWYYLAKRKHLAAYLRDTPPWALDMQRRGLLS
jgi:hypothetical protein